MKELINNGIFIINKSILDSSPKKNKTVVVLGIPRSGTTMTAQILAELGVYMGDTNGIVTEDTQLSRLLEKEKDIDAFKKLVNNRDKEHKLWGWKRPDAFRYISKFENIITNPHFIFMFRDPLAISLRENISMGADIFEKMSLSQKRYNRIIQYLSKTSYPCLMVSYEKAITKRGAFINSLTSFLDLEIDKNTKANLKNLIDTDNANYLKHTAKKNREIRGNVDGIYDNVIKGWACEKGINAPVELEIIINKDEPNMFVHSILAKEHRVGLKKRGIGKGNHGFSYNLANYSLDDSLHKVEVYVKGKNIAITESPLNYKKTKPFFFVHIPKTGGTSLRKVISKPFNALGIYPNGAEMKKNNGYPSYKNLLNNSPDIWKEVTLLRGHYPFIFGELIGKDTIYLTMLREPVRRCISYLHHVQRKKPNLSLKQILKSKPRETSNLQVKFFADNKLEKDLTYFREDVIDNVALKFAKKNIDRCNFIAINEEFDNSVMLLNKMFNLEVELNVKKNEGKYNKVTDPAIIKELEKRNELDIELYNYAKLKYDKLKKEFGID